VTSQPTRLLSAWSSSVTDTCATNEPLGMSSAMTVRCTDVSPVELLLLLRSVCDDSVLMMMRGALSFTSATLTITDTSDERAASPRSDASTYSVVPCSTSTLPIA